MEVDNVMEGQRGDVARRLEAVETQLQAQAQLPARMSSIEARMDKEKREREEKEDARDNTTKKRLDGIDESMQAMSSTMARILAIAEGMAEPQADISSNAPKATSRKRRAGTPKDDEAREITTTAAKEKRKGRSRSVATRPRASQSSAAASRKSQGRGMRA